jgi:flagellar motility protein MotE (MotC chaperone)
MKLKDIIALGILSLLSFPLVLLGILLGMGKIHMSFGDTPLSPEAKARLAEHAEGPAKRDSASVGHGSNVSDDREAEIDRREAQALEEQKRLEALREDVTKARDSITRERERLEKMLGRTDSLEAIRLKALAGTFSSMKADDAAKILVGMDDMMVTGILRTITDDKSRAKILASIGKVSDARASQLAKYLGTVRNAKPAEPVKEEKKDAKEAKPASPPHTQEKAK